MRDMQEKVEAIAARSLSLGERSQKIGEILELINEIAEQTNLLASLSRQPIFCRLSIA